MKKFITAIAIAVATVMAWTPSAHAATLFSAGFETGDLSEFDATSTANGSITASTAQHYSTGSYSGYATYTGGGANGYSRGQEVVSWSTGDDISYQVAFRLPTGFLSAQQGQVTVMRWDNWSIDPTTTDQGGLAIRSDGKLVVVRQKLGSIYDELTDPYTVSENTWYRIAIRQKFSDNVSPNPTANTKIYVNGTLFDESTAANTTGREITRIRWGIVSIAAGAQTNNLSLYVDACAIWDQT